MGLRAPQKVPTTTADWDRWAREVDVEPDDGTVTTEKIVTEAVTEPKLASGAVSNRVLRDSAANSAMGRSASTPGDAGDMPISEGQFLGTRGGATGGYLLTDGDIPASIARDTEVAAAIAAAPYLPAATTGTYTGAFTGTTSDPAPVIRWSKVGPLVALYLPSNTAVSNSTAFTVTGAPVAIRPARIQTVLTVVQENSVNVLGTASMGTDGTLTFGVGAAGAAFTASGAKGFPTGTFTYSLD